MEDGQLRVEPVPEQDAGKRRRPNMACCQRFLDGEGKLADLPPLGSFRWIEPLNNVETDDMRVICSGYTPSFYDAPLTFSLVNVVVAAFAG